MSSLKASDDREEVVWRGSRAYTERVKAFTVKPERAFNIAWKESERVKYPIFFREPEFVVGQWYWFGKSTKNKIPLTGYYVNGHSGKVEYRQSEKLIKAGARWLPKDAWKTTESSATEAR